MLFGLCSNIIYYIYDRCHDMIKPHDFGTKGLLVDDAMIVKKKLGKSGSASFAVCNEAILNNPICVL